MKLNRYIVPAAVMIVLTGCNGKEEKKEAAPVDEKPRVEVMLVNAGDVAQEGTYTATVEAFKTNNISSSTPNRIKSISVDVGSRVAKGQRLVVLDDVNIAQLKVRLDNARVELDRAKKLLAIGAGTQQTVDQLQAEVDAQARQYANMVENTVLTSPISGVVTARNYDPGDMTGQLPILTIEQVQPVKVIVNISENEYSKIRKNMPVAITLDTYPDAEFTGRVHIISPTVDPATRTFSVEILIDNPGDKVLPGMFARVNLGFGSENRVVIPDRAVVKMVGSGNKYVYVLKADGTVSYNRVELGRRMGESYEVISGVADGDKVVVAGQSRLADGVAVEVIERTANTSEK
jgi:RND family efflux transporter MFP subunit